MGTNMRFLIIGLGSMGKRRVRNLKALGYESIAGFDLRRERCEEASAKYGIKVYDSYAQAVEDFKPIALIISTGPKFHMDYALDAAKKGINCFIEASVVDIERIVELDNATSAGDLIMAPSCTMKYHPVPIKVKDIIENGKIGKPLSFNYITGQYLPDWHPWEDIKDFYVSEPETGGCREIVPFELTWINAIFGMPQPLACVKAKLSSIDADIDDFYHCILRYPEGMIANITIEVLSRPRATRALYICGSEGRLIYSANENCVKYIRVGDEDWSMDYLIEGTVETGYINPEEPYIAEISEFIQAVKSKKADAFPNTLTSDISTLKLLTTLESLSEKLK